MVDSFSRPAFGRPVSRLSAYKRAGTVGACAVYEACEAEAMLRLVERGVCSLADTRATIAISPTEESALRKLHGNIRAECSLRQRARILRIFEQLVIAAGLAPAIEPRKPRPRRRRIAISGNVRMREVAA
jgi:hypothetical protein